MDMKTEQALKASVICAKASCCDSSCFAGLYFNFVNNISRQRACEMTEKQPPLYKIVWNFDKFALECEVNELLSQGWELGGNLFVDDKKWYQSMLLPSKTVYKGYEVQ